MSRWRIACTLMLAVLCLALVWPMLGVFQPSAWPNRETLHRLSQLARTTLLLVGLTLCVAVPAGVGLAILLERTDLPSVLRGADLFLLPSESESFGLAALEAMSCGVPVIASRVGGVPEVVIDGETGLLAPVGDVAAMAAHVVRLIADAPLRARLGAAARRRAEAVFPLEATVG